MIGLVTSLRSLNAQVWLQATGRSLCQMGFGLINFYIPVLFVNQVGLSSTAVGFALGIGSLAEIAGHFIGAIIADSPKLGRKVALSLAAIFGIGVTLLLAITTQPFLLTLACLLLGLSLSFYWSTSSAAVMDAAESGDRPRAFALMGVSEYLGVGIGVLGGSALLGLVKRLNQPPQVLFLFTIVVFLGFLLLIQVGMRGVKSAPGGDKSHRGLWVALQDKLLLLLILANIFFSTYVALVTTTVPLYFTTVVSGLDQLPGVSITSTANLFTWCYVGVGLLVQLPIAQVFSGIRRTRVLMLAMGLWAGGFCLLWAAGQFTAGQFFWGIAGLGMLASASVMYKPFAVAIVSDLAPESVRAAYMAVSSQAWTVGYFLGPILGGWAMDQSLGVSRLFWLVVAASTVGCLGVLAVFEQLNPAISAAPTPSTPEIAPET
jgi:MFS family permease